MSREVHVRFWESAEVGFLRATRLPLYRQSQIYGREGVELERSTLADWVGKSAALLEPLSDAIGRHVLAGKAIFADDTPVGVLAPGKAADVLAVQGNPLEDIRALLDVRAVVARGRVVH